MTSGAGTAVGGASGLAIPAAASGARFEVAADRAEERGEHDQARALSRDAGWEYERDAGRLEGVSLELAAKTYRAADRCYRRGRSMGRALRMRIRAERCESEEAARLAELARRFPTVEAFQ